MKSISAELRDAGNIIAEIGKLIEESQVEDGDPPFAIGQDAHHKLMTAAAKIIETFKNIVP